MDTDFLVTRKEIAQYLGISERTLWTYEQEGLPLLRGGNKNSRVRALKSEVQLWIIEKEKGQKKSYINPFKKK